MKASEKKKAEVKIQRFEKDLFAVNIDQAKILNTLTD
jgi:hypothetical protein